MKTTHTMPATIEARFRVAGLADMENAFLKVEVTFSYQPGYPGSRAPGGDPPEDPEVTLVSVNLVDGDGIDPDQTTLREWTEDWLNDQGFERACDFAEGER